MKEVTWAWVKMAGGLAVLVGGGELLVRGASRLAATLWISSLVIGLTVVAFGTSAPELAVSVLAALAGNADLALGNVVGSNIFNVFCVLGLSGIIAEVKVSPAALHFDIPVMIAVAVACLPIFFTGHLISRWEGGLFFFYYVAYTSYAIAAMLGGAGTSLALLIAGSLLDDPLLGPATRFRSYYLLGLEPIVWGLAVSLVTGIVVSFCTRPPNDELLSRLFDARCRGVDGESV